MLLANQNHYPLLPSLTLDTYTYYISFCLLCNKLSTTLAYSALVLSSLTSTLFWLGMNLNLTHYAWHLNKYKSLIIQLHLQIQKRLAISSSFAPHCRPHHTHTQTPKKEKKNVLVFLWRLGLHFPGFHLVLKSLGLSCTSCGLV